MSDLLAVGPKFTRPVCRAAAPLSTDICCPRPTSAANPPAAAAAVNRRNRRTDRRPFYNACRILCRPRVIRALSGGTDGCYVIHGGFRGHT